MGSNTSLIMRTVKYFWSLIMPPPPADDSSPSPSMTRDDPEQEHGPQPSTRATQYWKRLAEHNEESLKKMENNLIDVTNKLNTKIIGNDPNPFVKNL